VSLALWRIAAVTPQYTADDLSGTGARVTGGRWNSIGNPVVYSSESIALALHETVVHLRAAGLPLNRYLVRIDVPAEIWDARVILSDPPVGWDALPHGIPSVQAGDAWLAGGASALMAVPSIIVPEEFNVLINPLHPDTRHLKASMLRRWRYDPRLF